MVQEIKYFRAELDVEVFRNPFHVIVFENREVQLRRARADQDIAAGVSLKIEAPEISRREWRSYTWWSRVAVGVKERLIRCGGNGKALGLDIIVGIPWIDERRASAASKPIREIPIVGTQRAQWVAAGAKGGREWYTAAGGEN